MLGVTSHTTEFVTAYGACRLACNQKRTTPMASSVGGHVGYNWQAGQFVFGLEGEWQGADISGAT